jgi:hypothetical protein
MKKKYSLKEYLVVAGVPNLKIKKSYTLQDILLAKRELVGKAGDCHIYDPWHPLIVREINKILNKHNMAWVINRKRKGGKVYRGLDKIVRLDDTLPLPDNWEEITDSLLNQEESIHLHWKLRANLQTPRFHGNTMTINGVSFSTVI